MKSTARNAANSPSRLLYDYSIKMRGPDRRRAIARHTLLERPQGPDRPFEAPRPAIREQEIPSDRDTYIEQSTHTQIQKRINHSARCGSAWPATEIYSVWAPSWLTPGVASTEGALCANNGPIIRPRLVERLWLSFHSPHKKRAEKLYRRALIDQWRIVFSSAITQQLLTAEDKLFCSSRTLLLLPLQPSKSCFFWWERNSTEQFQCGVQRIYWLMRFITLLLKQWITF